MKHGKTDITCLQVLLEDASVSSAQRVILPVDYNLTPSFLFDQYLAYIVRFTLGLIKPIISDGEVLFSIRGTGISLIRFSGPLYSENGPMQSVVMRITGGVLVQPRNCHRGELLFGVERTDAGVVAVLNLADYCPLILGNSTPSILRKWLYRLTQAYIHRIVTVRFLMMVVKKMSAGRLCAKVVTIKPKCGENIAGPLHTAEPLLLFICNGKESQEDLWKSVRANG